jgi:hypothetical protein
MPLHNALLGREHAAALDALSREKYPEAFAGAGPWEYQPDAGHQFAVRFATVYGWTNIARDPTRWRFAQG